MFNLLLVSIGVTCVILSVMVFNDKINLLRNGVKVKGEVIDFEHSSNALITDEKKVLYIEIYKPIIRFKSDDGNIIRINGKMVGVPITIKAVGFPERMEYALSRPGGYLQKMANDGVVVYTERSENITVPKYEGVYSYEYLARGDE